MLYQNRSKGKEESALLRQGLSRAIRRLSIIFSLKSLLSLVKIESLDRMDSSCNIRCVLESPLAYCCQYLAFSQWDVKCLIVHKFGQKNIGSLLFLHVTICRKNGKFVTSVYRKPTFSGVFTSYEIFIPTYQKKGHLLILFHRSLTYVVISRHFILKSTIWRLFSWKKNYPPNLIDSCIK